MSGVYNVFLKWNPADRNKSTNAGRFQLVFADRYEADEFYRLMQTATVPNNTLQLFFDKLNRPSAQFWSHSGTYADYAHVYNFLINNLAPAFSNTLSIFLLNNSIDGSGRSTTLIPNPVTGPDWLSGGTFFIRNRRQPKLYWHAHNDYIHTSKFQRTKFRIELSDKDSLKLPPDQSQKAYFVRNDSVLVSVVGEATATGKVGAKKYVGVDVVHETKDSQLALVKTATKWRFEDLILKGVGVRFIDYPPPAAGGGDAAAGKGGDGGAKNEAETKGIVVPMGEGGADEWELC